MLGIPGTDSEIRAAVLTAFGEENASRFWQTYYQNYVDESDILFLKSMGFNCLRLPVNACAFFDSDSFETSTAVKELDRVISLCASQQIYAVIDLHAALLGQNPDWHSDNATGDYGFFKDPACRTQTALLWKRIARHYKDNPWVAGYDLLNEPCYFERFLDDVLLRFYADCIAQIRAVDDRHIIFLEGNTYARDFTMFNHNLDDRVAYTFHYYPFLQLPKQLHPPNLREKIKTSLHQDVTLSHLQEKLCRPIWCGETGHPLHALDTVDALQVFLELLEELNISWSLWPHKDARAMGLCYPTETSAYATLVRQATRNWNFWDIFNQDSILSVQNEADKHVFYRTLAKAGSDANRKFGQALRQIPFEKFHASLSDFRFENCEKNDPLMLFLQRTLRTSLGD